MRSLYLLMKLLLYLLMYLLTCVRWVYCEGGGRVGSDEVRLTPQSMHGVQADLARVRVRVRARARVRARVRVRVRARVRARARD